MKLPFFKQLSYWPLLLSGLVLLLLLAKNPFSERTLIPNFEPFPDAFHYLVPPNCFLEGRGWQLCRPDTPGVKPAVPPVYGLVLLPLFVLTSDLRAFYFVNVGISLLSLGLLFLICKKLKVSQLATFLTLTIFVTSYHVYWLPTLAMAENLILPFFLGGLLAFIGNGKLSDSLSIQQLLGISILAGLQYGTKFAGLPIMTVLIGVSLLRLLLQEKKWQPILTKSAALLLPVSILFFAFGGLGVINSIVSITTLLGIESKTTTSEPTSAWFSLQYFSKNSLIYLQTILGQPSRFLWDTRPMIWPLLSALGSAGLLLGLWQQKWRWLSVLLTLTLALQISVLSLFYTADARYIFVAYPIALTGLLLLITAVEQWLSKQKNQQKISLSRLWQVGLVICLVVYSVFQFDRIKSQISLNLRYAETPWWYIASRELDRYFTTIYPEQKSESDDKKPFVISAIIPYLLDAHTSDNFLLLPLDQNQDFRGHKKAVWGDHNYDNLVALYQQKLDEGYDVFITGYGLGNEAHLQKSFEDVKTAFVLTEVQTGCFNACNIYQLSASQSAQLP